MTFTPFSLSYFFKFSMLFTGIILLVGCSLKESEHSGLVLKLKENENTVLTVHLTSRSTFDQERTKFFRYSEGSRWVSWVGTSSENSSTNFSDWGERTFTEHCCGEMRKGQGGIEWRRVVRTVRILHPSSSVWSSEIMRWFRKYHNVNFISFFFLSFHIQFHPHTLFLNSHSLHLPHPSSSSSTAWHAIFCVY